MKPRYPIALPLLWPAVFLSGTTALVYEIVWTRELALVLGSTTGAAAAVLSSFMLGLALGAVFVGRSADRSTRPLRWYGLLEIGIGIYALAFSTLLGIAGSGFLAACAVVVIPAALMGATLPVLARAAADTTERGARAMGSLYGVNTLGAVFGALLATFVLLETLGLAGATIFAAVINILLGVGFYALSVPAGQREIFAADEEAPTPPSLGDAEWPVVAAFFIAGFAGLALEIAWVRLLVYFLEGFTIAFGLMLATYLLGLGAGAIGGTEIVGRSQNARRLLGRVLLIEAVLALGTFLLTGVMADQLEAMRARYLEASSIDFAYGAGLFWSAIVIIFPATFFAGMLLPIVARIALSDRESVARQTGFVYAASTLGAVIAPPIAAFWLIPAFGVPGTIAAMAFLLLGAGTWIAIGRGPKEWVIAGAAAVLLVATFLAADLSTPLVERSHVFRQAKAPRRLVEFREGLMAGVSVVEQYRDGSRLLYVDGFSAAETSRQYGYMRMLGHLPVLMHPKPNSVCVIAFGTGTTAGAAAVHDDVKKVTCVEIEPSVYDVASEFKAANRSVLDSPKVEAIVADGREFVGRDGESFDVITLEPLMPYTPGAVYLYTREFYAAARKRLGRGGLLCQWIPPQGVSNADMRRLVKSVSDVFDHVSLWYFEHAVLVLGSERAPRIDPGTFLKRSANRAVLEDLEQARVGGPDHLLAAHVVSGDALRALIEDDEAMVDDNTDLEFRPLPRRFGRRSKSYHAENLEFLAKAHQSKVDWLDSEGGPMADARRFMRSGFGAALSTLAVEMRRRVDGGLVVPASVLRPVVERDPRGLFARSIYERRRYAELVGAGKYDAAAFLRYAPDRSAAFVALAEDAEEGSQRWRFYLTLAIRDNALLDPELLEKFGAKLEGAERRFVVNRAYVQRGQPVEAGEEKMPVPTVPDLLPALEAGDRETARLALEMSYGAGLDRQAEQQAWDWYLKRDNKREAALFLHTIGSSKALAAARKLRTPDDLVALAPVFAAHYPRVGNWERLCTHKEPRVREAAADAAASLAHSEDARAFLPALSLLLRDEREGVRLSAFIAFRGIDSAAEKSGYDHRKPADKALAYLDGLAAGKVAAVGGK
ncbi:MAG: fused MFS/spermidine synthase [Planctomycetota bacterium]|jgi:spermidine synthase